MKSTICLVIIAAIVLISTSCNRSYSCICDYTLNGQHTSSHENIQGSKNHALHECCTIRSAQIRNNGGTNVSCAVPI